LYRIQIRAAVAVAAVSLAALAAGCGGSSSAATSGGTGGGACTPAKSPVITHPRQLGTSSMTGTGRAVEELHKQKKARMR